MIRFLHIRHFLHQQTCFPEWVHCQVIWILGGSTLNSFLDGRKSNSYVIRSRLFTYDIMKHFNCIYLYGFLNQSLGLILGFFFFIKITACMPLWNVTNLQLYFPHKSLIVSSVINGNSENSGLLASSYTEGYK
jgi:hypothetical protein